MSDSGGWSLTESGQSHSTPLHPHQQSADARSPNFHPDPGVFTGLLHELGVKGLEVEELYGLDADLLRELQ